MSIAVEEISRIILKKLRDEELDREEAATLAEWESHSPENSVFLDKLTNEQAMSEKMKSLLRLEARRVWNKIENELEGEWEERKPLIQRMRWIKYAAAACVLLLLALTGYYLFRDKVISPGGNKATLTLANGTVVDLARTPNGNIETVAGVEITKVKDGALEYRIQKHGEQTAGPAYHVLTTPRAGAYQLKLPDDTRVWLNAASNIRFPVSFGNERNVEIQGEAYFEVAPDPTKKFLAIIRSADGTRRGVVEVTGTRFTVRAYGEEKNITATLLEGTVKVAAYSRSAEGKQDLRTGEPKFLIAGQQARWGEQNMVTVVEGIDTAQFVSWKEGIETFKNAGIQTVMQYISRWYDVEVVYADSIPDRGFSGGLDRTYTLKEALEVLQSLGYRFAITGRKVTVKQ